MAVCLVGNVLKARSWDNSSDDYDQCTHYAAQVEWLENSQNKWTTSTATGMTCCEFGRQMGNAAAARWKDGKLAHQFAGELRIYELYIPKGFSGGGAYTLLPAQALGHSTGAGDVHLSLNITGLEQDFGCSMSVSAEQLRRINSHALGCVMNLSRVNQRGRSKSIREGVPTWLCCMDANISLVLMCMLVLELVPAMPGVHGPACPLLSLMFLTR